MATPSNVYFDSPLGPVLIQGSKRGVSRIKFVTKMGESDPIPSDEVIECLIQLKEYFAGEREEFDLRLDYGKASAFYQEVWRLVRSIPHGHTRTYSDIANTIDRPHASRAVGQANGHNPFMIVVPCHRVIGKDGALTGYAHGLSKKEALLALENPVRYKRQASLFKV